MSPKWFHFSGPMELLCTETRFDLLYQGADLTNVKCKRSEDLEIYNSIIDDYDLDMPKLQFTSSTEDNKAYIQKCLDNWFIPDKYKNIEFHLLHYEIRQSSPYY